MLGERRSRARGWRRRSTQATGGDKETRIFLRADEAVDYGELMEVKMRPVDAPPLPAAEVALPEPRPAARPRALRVVKAVEEAPQQERKPAAPSRAAVQGYRRGPQTAASLACGGGGADQAGAAAASLAGRPE